MNQKENKPQKYSTAEIFISTCIYQVFDLLLFPYFISLIYLGGIVLMMGNIPTPIAAGISFFLSFETLKTLANQYKVFRVYKIMNDNRE